MSARALAFPLTGLLIAACSEAPPTTGYPTMGPSYGASAIYRFDFQGIRLGMARDELCRRLIANGYSHPDRRSCGPLAELEEGELDPGEGFDGAAEGWCRREPCRPDSPAGKVQYVSMTYERIGGRDFLRTLSVSTAEPKSRAELMAATIREWGEPTYYHIHGYTQMIYGASPGQANFANRETFARCVISPQCETGKGTDCGAVLSRFATVNASVTVYGGSDRGSRVIRLEDPRRHVRRSRASGDLRGRRFIPPPHECLSGDVH